MKYFNFILIHLYVFLVSQTQQAPQRRQRPVTGQRDLAPGPRDRAPGPRDRAPGPRDRAPGPRDRAPGPRDRGIGPRDRDPTKGIKNFQAIFFGQLESTFYIEVRISKKEHTWENRFTQKFTKTAPLNSLISTGQFL